MSRIGRLPIPLEGVEAKISDSSVSFKGKRGTVSYPLPEGVTAKIEEGFLHIGRADDSQEQRRLHGVTRAEINNRVLGVSKGHTKILIVQGKGYSAEVKPKALDMQI